MRCALRSSADCSRRAVSAWTKATAASRRRALCLRRASARMLARTVAVTQMPAEIRTASGDESRPRPDTVK